MGTRAGLDMVSKRKIPSPRRTSNPDHPIVQSVAWDSNMLGHRIKNYDIDNSNDLEVP
jgi:hypothetical protein